MTATITKSIAPNPQPVRCPTCGGRKVGPAGCRSCPVRIVLTPAGLRALATR